MADRLQLAAKQTRNERSHMLLEYLAGHERQLEDLVSRFGDKATATALNTWVSDYEEQFHPSSHDRRDHPYADMSTAEIMNEVQEQHRRVIALYDHLEDFVQASARDLVKHVIELEEQELLRIVQSANRLEDI